MTLPDDARAPLWLVGSGRPRPRPVPAKCGLCQAPPASEFGLCRDHLAAAAAEASRLLPRPPDPDDGRTSSTPYRSLCRRCGRPGHDARGCDA